MNTHTPCGREKLRQALLWQLDRFIPYDAIEDVIWGGNEDGGPLRIKQAIHKYTYQLRKQGHEIEAWTGVGLKMRQGAA